MNKMEMLIANQQKVAADILRMAQAAGMVAIVWTVEDAKEALERAASERTITTEDNKHASADEAADFLNFAEDTLAEGSIAAGWGILENAANDWISGNDYDYAEEGDEDNADTEEGE
jgi:biotin carboxylase